DRQAGHRLLPPGERRAALRGIVTGRRDAGSAVAPLAVGIVKHRRADPRRDGAVGERCPDRLPVAGASVLDQGESKAVPDPRAVIARSDMADAARVWPGDRM